MLYFDDQQCDVCRGAVDLSIASSVVGVDVPTRGHGFEIATPNRVWVFAPSIGDEDELELWIEKISSIISDMKETRRRQQRERGIAAVKEGWVAINDDAPSHGKDSGARASSSSSSSSALWSKRWLALDANYQLHVYDGPRGEASLPRLSVDLRHVAAVRRSVGVDYYTWCFDVVHQTDVLRVRPRDRGDMKAWLSVLERQLFVIRAARANAGSNERKVVIHHGWLSKRGGGSSGTPTSENYKRRYCMLVMSNDP